MIKNVVLILTTLLLLAGCSWGKYSEPKYYDLTTPEPLPALKYPIQIKNFGNNTAVKQRMIYRTANDELLIDEYARFVQPPEKMLERYLATAFSAQNSGNGKSGDEIICIYGKIFLVEFDVSSLEARLGIEYTIERKTADGMLQPVAFDSTIFRSQATSASPEVMTRALSRCAAQFTDQLYLILEQSSIEKE